MYLASKTSVNMADILTALVLILVNVISIVEDVNGDYDYPWCPTLVEGCYCRRKYNTDHYIYCEYLGNLQEIPEFNQSDIMFKELHFRYDTRINLVQKDSFEGLMIQNLWLQSLHITHIDRDAFVGLENNLTHLHLGDNHITNIHRDSIVHLQHLQYLGLHNNLMDSVPTFGNDFPELTYLYLFNNLITEIPSSAFRGMGSLKGLKLNNNEIIALRTGVFDPLESLIDLELQGNRLATLPGNIFRNLGELKKLDLSHNRIHLLLTEAFYGLRSLETLHLNHNSLSEFQSGMFMHISRIKYLTLRNNYATSIEQTTFNLLRSIRTLDLSFNRISRIETKSFRFLYRLEKLYLTGNLLTHLDFFRKSLLGRIEILDVSNNNITQLVDPSVFEPLSKLEQLDLCENALGTLNAGVFQELRLLKTLKLAKNPLYVLEEGVLANLSLRELDLTECHLRQLHVKAFESVNNLNYLWLDNNELEDIPTRLFNNTGKLSILSLRNNKLTKLRRDMFKGLSKLEALHLDWNNLKNITEYSFVFLASLRSLTATYNQITELYEHSFNDLKSLISLDLSHNKITSPGRGFTRFQNIQFLTLKGNPMRNINWFSLGYITLQNLKFLDLSYCDIETIYLDGLILFLKTPLEEFELNLVGNPLSCSGCDLSWSSYIPYNSILNPSDVTCYTPNELKGRPALCSVDNPCLDLKMKNNSEIEVMCADAEARWLAMAQTTTESRGNLTTENTYRENNPDVPTSSPEISNSTQKMHTDSVGLNFTKNYSTTLNEATNHEKTLHENESTTIHQHQEVYHETTTMTTNFTDKENTEMDLIESEIGSGEEVDEDFMMTISNDSEHDGKFRVVDTKDTVDIIHTDHTVSIVLHHNNFYTHCTSFFSWLSGFFPTSNVIRQHIKKKVKDHCS